MEEYPRTITYFWSQNAQMISVDNGEYTAFAGVVDNENINMETQVPEDRVSKLLIRAVNNRTRERNYFRLYNQLLENEITEAEFDREIDDNEDDYVVSNNEIVDREDLKAALALSKYLKDVKDVDDMADIFSFDNNSMKNSLIER